MKTARNGGEQTGCPVCCSWSVKSGQGQRLVNKFLLIQRIPWCGRLIMPDGSQRNQCAHWLCRGLSGTAVLSALRGSVSKGNCLSHRLSEIMGEMQELSRRLAKIEKHERQNRPSMALSHSKQVRPANADTISCTLHFRKPQFIVAGQDTPSAMRQNEPSLTVTISYLFRKWDAVSRFSSLSTT